MSIDSTEVSPEGKTLQNRRPLSSEDKATVPAAAKGVVKTVELTGKAAIGTVKLTKNILSTPVRLIGRNLWGSKVPAVLAGVAITAGSAGGGADAFKEKTGAAFQDPVKTVRLAGAATADALTEAVDKAISKTKQSLKLELGRNGEEMDAELSAVVGFYWPGASEEDRQKIAVNVSLMHEYYKGTTDQPALLPPETYEILESKSQLIVEKCANVPWLANAVIGLAIAESRGGVDGGLGGATKDGALGPFMMTADFIREHGYEPTNDENDPRLSWEITLPIVVDELIKRTEHFGGNLGFAVWSWHRGVKAVDDDIIQLATQKGFSVDVPIAQIVKDNSFTELDLEEDALIKRALNQPGQDSTSIFLLRNAAGVLVWVHVQRLADKIKSEEAQEPLANIVEFSQKPQVEEN